MFSANPRSTPSARLLRELHYDEAQEIASSGAKVLHPRCVLPVRMHRIPLHVFATQTPDLEGTHISMATADASAKVKAVCVKKGITLVSMESPGMWHEVGFLADAFADIQAPWTVHRPGLHVGNQCHGVAGSPGQHAGCGGA